jgi:hypothetical protein
VERRSRKACGKKIEEGRGSGSFLSRGKLEAQEGKEDNGRGIEEGKNLKFKTKGKLEV